MSDGVLYQLIINLNVTCQLLLSALIFCRPLQRKRLFLLLVLLSAMCGTVLLLCAVQLRILWNVLLTRFAMRLLQFSIPLIFVLLCYEGGIYIKLKTWCASVATMEISAALFSFLLALCGVDERLTISFRNTTKLLSILESTSCSDVKSQKNLTAQAKAVQFFWLLDACCF